MILWPGLANRFSFERGGEEGANKEIELKQLLPSDFILDRTAVGGPLATVSGEQKAIGFGGSEQTVVVKQR